MRLGITLDVIHQNPGKAYQDAASRIGGDQFVLHRSDYAAQQPVGAGVADELEDGEDIGQYHQVHVWAFVVHVNHHERDDGYQVYQSVEREDVAETCLPTVLDVGILSGRGNDAQGILDGEDERRQVIEGEELGTVRCRFFKGTENDGQDGAYDEEQYEALGPFVHQLPVDAPVEPGMPSDVRKVVDKALQFLFLVCHDACFSFRTTSWQKWLFKKWVKKLGSVKALFKRI